MAGDPLTLPGKLLQWTGPTCLRVLMTVGGPGLTGSHPSAPRGQMSVDLRRVPSITPPSGGRAWGPLPGGRAPCPTSVIYACAGLWGYGKVGFTSFPRHRAMRSGSIAPRLLCRFVTEGFSKACAT
jgi:hypothetical protein